MYLIQPGGITAGQEAFPCAYGVEPSKCSELEVFDVFSLRVWD